ncbi:hypothetical protein [Microbacterium sp. SS28]|uniref:hypothetical protein n=1 Tax=Microbacterium sp. SS28 TaxID=2919948 RepID=UPI001FA95C5C|nr:hypothetical protein [Microbacterium sp. SS28]
MSDIRDTLPTGGDSTPAGTSPTTYPTTPSTYPSSTSGTSSGDAGSGLDAAKHEAAHVAGTAKDEAKHVAATAKEEAKEVGREARTQISRLYDEARGELSMQAADRQDRLAEGLRTAGGELRSMADSSTDGGIATDVVRQVSHRLDGMASWLGSRDPGAVLDEVKRYARRRPGMFLAFAALAGVAVGRLTRSLAAGSPDGNGHGNGQGTYQRQLPAAQAAGMPPTRTPAYASPTVRTTAERGTDTSVANDPMYRSGELG